LSGRRANPSATLLIEDTALRQSWSFRPKSFLSGPSPADLVYVPDQFSWLLPSVNVFEAPYGSHELLANGVAESVTEGLKG